MTKVIGTAADHTAFYTAFTNFLGTIGWTDMGAVAGFKCYRAPGAAAGGEFFLYSRMFVDAAANCYTLEMRGAAGCDLALPIGSQRLISPSTFTNLWLNEIKYWFYGNNRRVALVAKCNTLYMSAYAGLLVPFAMPEEYLRPFYVGGSYNQPAPYNVVDSASRFIVDPGTGSAYYLNRQMTAWVPVANHLSNVNADVAPVRGDLLTAYAWPHRTQTHFIDTTGWNAKGLNALRPTLDGGTMPNWAAHIVDATSRVVVGVLDGVFSASGFNRASEQVLTADAFDYRLFQNIGRVTGRDFMAIKEI